MVIFLIKILWEKNTFSVQDWEKQLPGFVFLGVGKSWDSPLDNSKVWELIKQGPTLTVFF
jgi:hypothetical protein